MSIITSFDTSKPLISPEMIYQKGNIATKCIATFSKRVLEDVLGRFECKEEVKTITTNGDIIIYSIMYKGEKILFYMSPVGAPAAGCIINEVSYLTGATNFFVFGSCGALDGEKTKDRFIIPTASYRDEGFSYHYVPVGDYIDIVNCQKLKSIFEELKLPYVLGKSWTTDAIYRETQNNVAKRKADGCICVEMESAGLQAVCDFEGINLYTFFFASDLINGDIWKNMNLGTDAEKEKQVNCFDIALLLTSKI